MTRGVVLTGDVHHAIGSADQAFADRSEPALAVEWARIAADHGLKATLFLTARAVLELEDARPLADAEHVEIGGHGWNAFQPGWRYRKVHRLFGTPHGPGLLQRRMVARTCGVLERFSGTPVATWRNHAYTRDANTPRALGAAGIRVWSDEVDESRTHPYRDGSGLVVLPINTVPDHERVFHGGQTPETAAGLYTIDAWCDRVCDQVEAVVSAGGVATILAHPICMRVADDWRSFARLCSFLERFPSLWARETAPAS